MLQLYLVSIKMYSVVNGRLVFIEPTKHKTGDEDISPNLKKELFILIDSPYIFNNL